MTTHDDALASRTHRRRKLSSSRFSLSLAELEIPLKRGRSRSIARCEFRRRFVCIFTRAMTFRGRRGARTSESVTAVSVAAYNIRRFRRGFRWDSSRVLLLSSVFSHSVLVHAWSSRLSTALLSSCESWQVASSGSSPGKESKKVLPASLLATWILAYKYLNFWIEKERTFYEYIGLSKSRFLN